MSRPVYSDPATEYQIATSEVGVVAPPLHRLVWVMGPDAVEFLQGILSQDLTGDPVARTFLLEPTGRVVSVGWVLVGADRVGLAVDGAMAETVAEKLGHYKIRVKADISVDHRPGYELWGPESTEVIDRGWVERDGVVEAAIPLPGLARVLVVGDDPPAHLPRLGSDVVTAVRVEAGEPLPSRDFDEAVLPHETGLVGEAVSFTKGCFLGYELVERVEARGAHSPRRLMGLAVTRNVIPPEGAEVWAGDRRVGRMTSVVESWGVGAPIGLVLARRGTEPGDEVEVRWQGGSAPAVVRPLPMRPSL
ncbi:MAG: aminomethyltransferase [Acidimicrobiia bacterium]|nr:MAG: aminomethyltransferase [Acidimicrobiia bacterium]